MTYNPSGNTADTSAAAAQVGTYEEIAWQLLVDGQNIRRIISFGLHQSINAHHSFELRVYHTELEDPRAYRIDRSKDLLGKNLTLILGTQVQKEISRFTGIITEVGFEEKAGLYGEVVLKGYSPTILLEGGEHLHSFYNKTLESIVSEAGQSVSGKLEMQVSPRFTGNIEYTTQYRESHFEFLNRLSDFHGEWFYYDGEKLQFGKPSRQPEQELQYARHIQHMRMSMQVVPMNFNHIGYRNEEDQRLSQQSSGKVEGLNYYGDIAVKKSDELYSSAVKHHPWQYVTGQGDLLRITKVNKSASAAKAFVLEGQSKHPAPRPGLRMRIMMGTEEMGEYLVTEVQHYLENVDTYSCSFRAIPADLEVLPLRNGIQPVCEPQIAIVKKNDDPTGQGRVRVQFQWQEGDNMTPWLRVMTPDAGSSDKVSKNRGFVFVPEVGDQVMVGFEQGNPDAPFVLGSLFHGKISTGGGSGNNSKSLSTKSGHTVTLNDGGGINIVDKTKLNHIDIDGDSKVTVTGDGTIKLVSKGNTMTITSQDGKIEISSASVVDIKSPTINIGDDKTTTINLKGQKVNINATDYTVTATNNKIHGTNHICGGETKIDGGNVFIN